MKVGYSSFGVLQRRDGLLLLMTTLPFSSTILPPWDQTSQLAKSLPSPTALPSAKPAGLSVFFRSWQISRNPSVFSGNLSNPASLTA